MKLKRIVLLFYIVTVAVMAIATIVEKNGGGRLYDAWWFTVLWALLCGGGIVWLIKRRVRRLSTVVLHLSFVIILLGALLTRLTARQGFIHLREGVTEAQYMTEEGHLHALPFILRLDSFRIVCHEGTTAAADYESHLTIIDNDNAQSTIVSMNHICSKSGIRLYQHAFDDDGHGTVLSMSSDPWGITITYIGYALLFIGLVWMLIDPHGAYRQVLRSPLLKRGLMIGIVLFSFSSHVSATPRVLPKGTADKFGHLNILYNDRICPVQTYAYDFTKKLTGKHHYGDFTAEQVLTGFIFFPDDWNTELLINNKGSEIQDAKAYERLMIVMELQEGKTLKLFPYTTRTTTWYAPVDDIDADAMPFDNRLFTSTFFNLLLEEITKQDYKQVDFYLDKLLTYQQKNGGHSIPSDLRLKAERMYNAIPFATILFMVCLTMGFLTLGLFICQIMKGTSQFSTLSSHLSYSILVLSFLALTLCEVLRWIVSGTIPMSNGYETMLLMAWMIQLITLLLYRRFHILLTFGFLMSGFFLLVSHISQMNPQIGHLMPVLRSPLLALHVSIIMMAFALLSLTFICGITALAVRLLSKRSEESIEALAMLSRVFLFPAMTALGLGIFIGAVWANISWGTYWSWDPKETWALITFMVYAVAIHDKTFPVFKRPVTYHLYVTLAFLTILMTYFGVNYLLGGMHSYA